MNYTIKDLLDSNQFPGMKLLNSASGGGQKGDKRNPDYRDIGYGKIFVRRRNSHDKSESI